MNARFRQHKDLKARVFLSVGEAEAADPLTSAAEIASAFALVARRLASRKYSSLELATRVFTPGEPHPTVLPVAYTHGLTYLWAR